MLMPEQFGFQHALRDRGTVHRDKRFSGCGAGIMDSAREQFLAGSGFARQQDRGRGARRDSLGKGHGCPECGTPSDDAVPAEGGNGVVRLRARGQGKSGTRGCRIKQGKHRSGTGRKYSRACGPREGPVHSFGSSAAMLELRPSCSPAAARIHILQSGIALHPSGGARFHLCLSGRAGGPYRYVI